MLFFKIFALVPLLAVVSAAPTSRAPSTTAGTIISPARNTVIAPGQSFRFEYDARGDYGVSSFNYTVFLYTTMPASFASADNFATGHYFGRFAEPNYPGACYGT